MGLVAILVAKILDPISFAICLIVVLFSRRPSVIPIAAIVAAVASETLLTASQYTRSWGEGLVPAFVAGLVHAGIVFKIRSVVSRPKKQPAQPEATGNAPPADAALASTQHPRVWSIWHLAIPLLLLAASLTGDRIVHLFSAAVCALLGLAIDPRPGTTFRTGAEVRRALNRLVSPVSASPVHLWALAAIALFTGSWIPDIDWLFKLHRSPITHSILPYLAVRYLVDRGGFGDSSWNRSLLVLFGYGLASHLLIDIFQRGNLVAIPPVLEMPFLLANGVGAFVLARRTQEALLHSASLPAVQPPDVTAATAGAPEAEGDAS